LRLRSNALLADARTPEIFLRPSRAAWPAGGRNSGGVAGIEILGRLLLALRCHLRWIGSAGDAARPQLFALAVIFRLRGLTRVWRWLPRHDVFPLTIAGGCEIERLPLKSASVRIRSRCRYGDPIPSPDRHQVMLPGRKQRIDVPSEPLIGQTMVLPARLGSVMTASSGTTIHSPSRRTR
jgi:hypothetical protein